MKKKIGVVVLTLMIAAAVLIIQNRIKEQQQIYINEVRSWDCSTNRNGYYGSDYIELYNASEETISLNGWFVSDDSRNLKKCQIYDVEIAPNRFAMLYANGKKDTGDSLNFKLNSGGESIYLSDEQGYLVDSIYVPEQEFGTVYARMTDGASQWCIKEETTNSSNDEASLLPSKILEEPEFSHEGGFYDTAFWLKITASEGATIYYTLDGSVPTKDAIAYEDGIYIENVSSQPNKYSMVKNVVKDWLNYKPNPETVDKAVVVRAAAFDEHNQSSEVVTNTYFVGEEQYKGKNVLSVVAEYKDLFGTEGIFVTGDAYDAYYLSDGEVKWAPPNFLLSGRTWEIPGNVQLFIEGQELLNQEAGIRTQGGSNRLIPKKRMSFFSREEYSGSSYFENITFDGKRNHSFYLNSSILRLSA